MAGRFEGLSDLDTHSPTPLFGMTINTIVET